MTTRSSLFVLVAVLTFAGCADEDIAIKSTTDKVVIGCDVTQALTPEELKDFKVVAAKEFACELLKAFKETGIIPAAAPGEHRQHCPVLLQSSAKNTEGVQRICGDPIAIRYWEATRLYSELAAGLIPGYQPFSPVVTFDSPRTDSENCGEQRITGISMCGDEVFFDLPQVYTYPDPETTAAIAPCHEEGHNMQRQLDKNGNLAPFHRSLLSTYTEDPAEHEVQAQCFCGVLERQISPSVTDTEIKQFENWIRALGDLPTHGTAKANLAAYRKGLFGGLEACLAS